MFQSTDPSVSKIQRKLDTPFLSVTDIVGGVWTRYGQTFFSIIFMRFRETAESDYQLRHVCPSVRLHGTTRLPMDRFL